ncbi:co-chaperone YbbN [Pelomonas sp. KK5]|uniref:thioredoxin family protein n=1 Tax=Pelomonas sp. KK5 TaxID=1855730 RepID=UPI00097C69F1|nr:thioredoxin domain-containing protein [Pelomonas sp. KK5]
MASALITSVDHQNFDAEVVQSDLPVLIDFWAPWCGPCIALNPTIDAVAALYEGRVKVVKANLDESKELADRFGVRGIPALFLLKQGEVLQGIHAQTKTRICVELDKHLA